MLLMSVRLYVYLIPRKNEFPSIGTDSVLSYSQYTGNKHVSTAQTFGQFFCTWTEQYLLANIFAWFKISFCHIFLFHMFQHLYIHCFGLVWTSWCQPKKRSAIPGMALSLHCKQIESPVNAFPCVDLIEGSWKVYARSQNVTICAIWVHHIQPMSVRGLTGGIHV